MSFYSAQKEPKKRYEVVDRVTVGESQPLRRGGLQCLRDKKAQLGETEQKTAKEATSKRRPYPQEQAKARHVGVRRVRLLNGRLASRKHGPQAASPASSQKDEDNLRKRVDGGR